MTWGLIVTGVERAAVREALEAERSQQLDDAPFDSWDDPIEQQMVAAIDAAVSLAELHREETVNVSCTGRAGEPPDGADAVSVSVAGVIESAATEA